MQDWFFRDSKWDKHSLRVDWLLLQGYSHGDFGIATSVPNIAKNGESDVFKMITNKHGYGFNVLQSDDINSMKYQNCRASHFNYKTKITDTYIRVSKFLERYWYNSKRNSLTRTTIKSKSYHLFYFFEDGKLKICKNNTKFYNLPNEIKNDVKLYETLLTALETSKIRLNYPILRSSTFAAGVRAIRNPLWRDLNVAIDSKKSVKNLPVKYSTLKYHYDKYGTVGLRNKFFGTTNKHIHRLLSTKYEYVEKYHTLKRHKIDHLFDANSLEILLRNNRVCIRSVDVIKILLSYNFGLRKIINFNRPDIFSDISGLYFQVDHILPENEKHLLHAIMDPKKSILDVHDELSMLQRTRKDASYLRDIPLTAQQEQLAYESDKYKFITANHTKMLLELGTKLNICVASYADYAISGNCTIVGVYSKEDQQPLACIEIKSGNIVQAKLAYNRPLRTDENLLADTLEWASERQLSTSHYDLTEQHYSEVSF